MATIDQAIDYLATPAVVAYFDACEYETYYRALKRVGPRRDFHSRVIPVLERFIALTDAEGGRRSVDAAMRGACARHTTAVRHNTLAVARAEQPSGVELLSLTEPLTFESLRAAYRLAAHKHHPDVGGDHDSMVAINEAFSLLHELLREQRIEGEAEIDMNESTLGGRLHARDAGDYRYICGELLLAIELDDWNIDSAALWLWRITSDEWQASAYAQDRSQQISLTEPAARLAGRLALSKNSDDAKRALGIAHTALRVAKAAGLALDWYVRDAEAVIAGTKRSSISINHPRQAENALRLGLIDEGRYRKALEKYLRVAGEARTGEGELQRFLRMGGFIPNLPTDGVAIGKTVKGRLVPEPGYYVTRIAQLTDDQQAEYLQAFGTDGTFALVRKYTFVRLVSLLESVLWYPDGVDPAAAAREVKVLGTLHDGTGGGYAADVAEVITDMASRSKDELRERASLLAAIENRGNDAISAVDASGIVFRHSGLGVPLTADYMKRVQLPLADLEILRKEGVLPESAQERRKRESWIRDSNALRSPAIDASEKKAFSAIDTAKTDLDGAIATWLAHCDALLGLGASMEYVEELQLGYWIDRLTGALVRAKRWNDAFTWLSRYFELPERYRGRSSPSEEISLRKRLERCRGKVA